MDRRTAVKNIALSLGLAVSGSTILSILNACSTDNSTIKPMFFNPSDLRSIDFLVDIILPATSSIGGKDLNISQFIDKMCKHVLDEEKQQAVRLGAEEFSKRFQKINGKMPSEGSSEEFQLMVATYFDISEEKEKSVFELLNQNYNDLSDSAKPDYNVYTFLTTIRELSLLGYFTSQTIMEREMEA